MSLKSQFLLDPDVVFLNHGSFGATPKPVFEAYQDWQRRLERQPVYFIDKELPNYLEEARHALGDYVNARANDLVFVPNATFGVNVVARSLILSEDDEVLITEHEYGACLKAWRFMSKKRGFRIIQRPLPLPLSSPEDTLELFWEGVTERTRVIFVSHISSPTAQRLPVEAICARAREVDIMTMVDGAHVPGQIPLDLQLVGADFYTGNGHKWLCSPKGSAFLYTRPERQPLIEPLVVGWGWGEDKIYSFGSDYLDYLQWLGTNDVAAYLAVPMAIRFQTENNWPIIQEQCHKLLDGAIRRICHLTGMRSVYHSDADFHQMAIAPIPVQDDMVGLKQRLLGEFRIEIPLIEWDDGHFIRVSVQGYNNQEDIDSLLVALENTL